MSSVETARSPSHPSFPLWGDKVESPQIVFDRGHHEFGCERFKRCGYSPNYLHSLCPSWAMWAMALLMLPIEMQGRKVALCQTGERAEL